MTLDDDLYGYFSRENQVKTPSVGKEYKGRQGADVICDAQFCVTIAVRFRRNGEDQKANVENIITPFAESRGEMYMYGLIATEDRGYGSMDLMERFVSCGIGMIMVMPQNLLRCHPFVERSYFYSTRGGEENENEK